MPVTVPVRGWPVGSNPVTVLPMRFPPAPRDCCSVKPLRLVWRVVVGLEGADFGDLLEQRVAVGRVAEGVLILAGLTARFMKSLAA